MPRGVESSPPYGSALAGSPCAPLGNRICHGFRTESFSWPPAPPLTGRSVGGRSKQHAGSVGSCSRNDRRFGALNDVDFAQPDPCAKRQGRQGPRDDASSGRQSRSRRPSRARAGATPARPLPGSRLGRAPGRAGLQATGGWPEVGLAVGVSRHAPPGRPGTIPAAPPARDRPPTGRAKSRPRCGDFGRGHLSYFSQLLRHPSP